MLYFDTSAILPYYREEAHSASIERLLRSQVEPVLINDLTRLEFASALARWVRMQEIAEPHAQLLSRAFDEDIGAGRYRITPSTREHTELARQWLLARTTSLRTLDALHLAFAAAGGAVLVTLDADLRAAAAALGIGTYALSPK